jgi:flagellar assembly factor FliW
VITDPWTVAPDYAPEISDADAQTLELSSFEDARLFGILTVPADPARITINLRAPIVVNAARRVAKQAVLLNDEYHTRHELSGG